MRFSAKGEYGVRAILDIALHGDRHPVRVREIAHRQAIPLRFLEQVMAALKRSGLVESYRGARGGYKLARPAEEISLADVIQAVDGPINLMECISENNLATCNQASVCVIRDIWQDVQSSILDALASISLRDICQRKIERDAHMTSMYHI